MTTALFSISILSSVSDMATRLSIVVTHMCVSSTRHHKALQKLPFLGLSWSIFSPVVLFFLIKWFAFYSNISLVKYVPEWMPGAGFKRKAKEWRTLSQAMINVPYNMVKEKFVSGLSLRIIR
jgi:hypothetical protein